MKKTFWQWLTTPIGTTWYDYYNKILNKYEEKARNYKYIDTNWLPPQRVLDRYYKANHLTEEQYEELTKRRALIIAVKILGIFKARQIHKDNEFFDKYYYDTEKRCANGKTLSEMFNN
jgi:hypothetical protein